MEVILALDSTSGQKHMSISSSLLTLAGGFHLMVYSSFNLTSKLTSKSLFLGGKNEKGKNNCTFFSTLSGKVSYQKSTGQ